MALAIAAAAVVAFVPGCSSDSSVSSDPTTTAGTEVNYIDSPEGIPAMIRAHVGERPEIRRLSINAKGFSVQVRDPVKRDNLDDYNYVNGTWSTSPVSVTLSDIQEYESVTFGLIDIEWDTIPDLVRQALDGLDLEGESIGGVSYDRLPGQTPRVYISVNGLRGSGRLIANADGTDVDIQRN